jgi:hypothetical protein
MVLLFHVSTFTHQMINMIFDLVVIIASHVILLPNEFIPTQSYDAGMFLFI